MLVIATAKLPVEHQIMQPLSAIEYLRLNICYFYSYQTPPPGSPLDVAHSNTWPVMATTTSGFAQIDQSYPLCVMRPTTTHTRARAFGEPSTAFTLPIGIYQHADGQWTAPLRKTKSENITPPPSDLHLDGIASKKTFTGVASDRGDDGDCFWTSLHEYLKHSKWRKSATSHH